MVSVGARGAALAAGRVAAKAAVMVATSGAKENWSTKDVDSVRADRPLPP